MKDFMNGKTMGIPAMVMCIRGMKHVVVETIFYS